MPSLRAQIVKRLFVTSLWVTRRVSGGVPDPTAPAEELEQYALRMRTRWEAASARQQAPRGAVTQGAEGAPVDGLWVVDDLARTHPADASERRLDPLAVTERVVLHLHGGAFCMGSPTTHRGLGAAISRTARASVLLPDYRLAPEHAFPAALDDALATYRWLVHDRGVPASRIAVTGDSAGGGLALSLLVRLRDDGDPLPACYVGLSPWTDLAGTGASVQELAETDVWLTAALLEPAARVYAGDLPVDDPRISPLYADLARLPPMLLHVGTDEILRDDALRFVDAARQAGVDASVGVFDGLWHVFQAFPMPESRNALREVGAFVRRHTGAPGRPVVTAA